MKGPYGYRGKKGSGLIGMGRSDLGHGNGIVLRKPLASKIIKKKNDEVSGKSRSTEKSQRSFVLRARLAKSAKSGKKSKRSMF